MELRERDTDKVVMQLEETWPMPQIGHVVVINRSRWKVVGVEHLLTAFPNKIVIFLERS